MQIHEYIAQGKVETVRRFHHKYPNRLMNERFGNGVSLLHVAVGYNQLEMVKFLLDEVHMPPNIQTKSGETVLHFKCSPTLSTFLCSRYPFLLAEENDAGQTPFDIVCLVGDEAAIKVMVPFLSSESWRNDALLEFIPRASLSFCTFWREHYQTHPSSLTLTVDERIDILDPVINRRQVMNFLRNKRNSSPDELLIVLERFRKEHGKFFRASDMYQMRKDHYPLFPYLLEWFITVERISIHPDGFNLFSAFRQTTRLVPYTQAFVNHIVDKVDVLDSHEAFLDELFSKNLYLDNGLVDGLMRKSSVYRNWIGRRVLKQVVSNKKIRDGLRDWKTFTSYAQQYPQPLEFLWMTHGSHMLPLDEIIEAHASWNLIKQVCMDGGLSVHKQLYTSAKKKEKRHIRTLTKVYKIHVHLLLIVQRKLPVDALRKLSQFY